MFDTESWAQQLDLQWEKRFEQREPPTKDRVIQVPPRELAFKFQAIGIAPRSSSNSASHGPETRITESHIPWSLSTILTIIFSTPL